jgi:hypothetical protein
MPGWVADGIGLELAIPTECGDCCDPCVFTRFCPLLDTLCISLSGFNNVGGNNFNGDYVLTRDRSGNDCGIFRLTAATAGSLTFDVGADFSWQNPSIPTQRYINLVITGQPPLLFTINLRIAVGTLGSPTTAFNCSSLGTYTLTTLVFSSGGYSVTTTEQAVISTPPCAGASAGPLSAPAWRTSTSQRLTLCTSLGQRLEHLPGCTGFRCKHECNSFDPEAIAHLSNVMTATPSIDCQECPGYIPRDPEPA